MIDKEAWKEFKRRSIIQSKKFDNLKSSQSKESIITEYINRIDDLDLYNYYRNFTEIT